MKDYTEDTLIEQPAIALLKQMGWQHLNCFRETFGEHGTLGREHEGEVVLVQRLRAALAKLNPAVSIAAREQAIAEITRDRSTMSLAAANREVYTLLKDNIVVKIRDASGNERDETVRIIDWIAPANNDFFLASQLWVAGDMYRRRPDLVGFVNGIPLVLMELKAIHRRLEHAYLDNLRDYKDTIPPIFWYNALILLSNGSQTRVGTLTAGWEHFFEWKKIESEDERGVLSLETVLRGVCDRTRLLDLTENFTLFRESGGSLIKMLAQNHQYLGVNNAIQAVRAIRQNQGRLGVFWHTQGSGKSLSMVFFSQKVLRKLPGSWTFLVVTDRQELDEQIYQTFAAVGAVTEREQDIHAGSGAQLQQLLRGQHRYLFTLIQKFHSETGVSYPRISDRDDIIVITDEAHRSQYDRFAHNMRCALPRAAFLAFTGTPLIAGEEKTKEVFGDYVSIYNFAQSIEDGATVPLYYENRIPELQLTNPNLNADIEGLVEAADLDEDQERKLEREFAREYHLLTRDDRLEKIAEDLVAHFIARGQPGKAMVVSVDKATAVRMYDKVRTHWQRTLEQLRAQLDPTGITYQRNTRRPGGTGETTPTAGSGVAPLSEAEQARLREKIAFMEHTDMAVVVSQSQNEVDDFRGKGLDIATHRRRIVREDLEGKFKNPDDPLRIVFVCAMWMTGFDVPSLTTIYLDKPMRNHTLMQTIARANRVFADKTNGLIVDYVGVFRNLQKALAIYGAPTAAAMGLGAGDEDEDTPIKDKSELVAALREKVAELDAFCELHGIDIQALIAASGFAKGALLDDAVDALVANDDVRKHFLSQVADAALCYRAILPDINAGEFTAPMGLFVTLSKKIRALSPEPDINGVMAAIEKLLDASIASEGYVIEAPGDYAVDRRIDLGQIDFDALRVRFEHARQHALAQELRTAVERKVQELVNRNRMRINYQEHFERLIAEYNAGSLNVQQFFDQLVVLAQELNAEEQRAIAENLNEEELAIFDLLTRPNITLSERDREQVKRVARDLLETLKHEKLVLDWKKRQSARAAVQVAIRDVLDKELPEAYTRDLYEQKCDQVFQHIYDAYTDASHNIYAA